MTGLPSLCFGVTVRVLLLRIVIEKELIGGLTHGGVKA